MQVVPVIDLKNGIAVHAIKGQRENYQPLQTRLCEGSEPLAVVEGLLRLHPFRSIYLADLDALTGYGSNSSIIRQLIRRFPGIDFWVDQGWPNDNQLLPANLVPVMGSESMSATCVNRLSLWANRGILSLDFFGKRYVGPPALLDHPELWPRRVILMTLAQVGANAGPDWIQLSSNLREHPRCDWIAAGGVRDTDDLHRLARLGVHAVLVASSLHQGQLDAATLLQYR